ncbi:MAG: histidine phosphatase family protein [Clostridiaceae bacterium]
MEILFIRHGETLANTKNYYYGFTDSPMTERGKEQARAAGLVVNKMKFHADKIYISERSRTRDTLELMGFKSNIASVDGRINEQNLGKLECMTYQEIEKKYPEVFREWNQDYHGYRVPEGESHMDLYERVVDFLEDLIRMEKGYNRKILVVSHGGVMASIYTYIIGGNMNYRNSAYFSNCAVLKTRLMSDQLVIEALFNPEEIVKIAKDLKV